MATEKPSIALVNRSARTDAATFPTAWSSEHSVRSAIPFGKLLTSKDPGLQVATRVCHDVALAPRSEKGTVTRSPPARVIAANLSGKLAAPASAPLIVKNSPVGIHQAALLHTDRLGISSLVHSGFFPCLEIGGAWAEFLGVRTSGCASRWAHPALQSWVAGAGGLQKEASFQSRKTQRAWKTVCGWQLDEANCIRLPAANARCKACLRKTTAIDPMAPGTLLR